MLLKTNESCKPFTLRCSGYSYPACHACFCATQRLMGPALLNGCAGTCTKSLKFSCFFDTYDIPHGYPVRKSIEDSIHESVVLVIWTDKLLDSSWCQLEIIEA